MISSEHDPQSALKRLIVSPVLFKSLKKPLQRVLLMESNVFFKPDEQS